MHKSNYVKLTDTSNDKEGAKSHRRHEAHQSDSRSINERRIYSNSFQNEFVEGIELKEINKHQDTQDERRSKPHDRSVLLQSESEGDGEATKSGIALSSFNFINSIVGAGILGMPYAMKQAGFILGIMLLILIAIITDYTVLLLVKCGTLTGENSYQGLMKSAFGKVGYGLLLLCQFLFPFIAMMGYTVVVGDSLTKFFQSIVGESTTSIITNRQFLIGMSTLLIMAPLSLFKDIAKLGWASFLSLACVIVVIVTVYTRLATLGREVTSMEGDFDFAHKGVAQAVGIMAFAFVCQHNTFLIYNSLHNNSISRFGIVTHVSVGVSLLATLLLGIGGYLTFKSYTLADILENYCSNDQLASAARICYGISMMLTYPIECFVCREIIELTLFPEKEKSTLRHIIITLVIVAAALPIPMITNCLGTVLELNGSLAATPLVFIFPCACYIKIAEGPIYSWRKIIAIIVLLLGVAILFLGTITAIIGAKNCLNNRPKLPWCNATMA